MDYLGIMIRWIDVVGKRCWVADTENMTKQLCTGTRFMCKSNGFFIRGFADDRELSCKYYLVNDVDVLVWLTNDERRRYLKNYKDKSGVLF